MPKVLMHTIIVLVCILAVTVLPGVVIANEIWVVPGDKLASSRVGDWATTTRGKAKFTFAVPDDMTDFHSARVVVIPKITYDITYNLYLSVSADGASQGVATIEDIELPLSMVENQMLEIDVSSIFPAGLVSGDDYVSLSFVVNDKVNRVKVVGLRFQYVGPTDDGFTSEAELTSLLDDNYIRNQHGTTQAANFQISGSGRVGSLEVDGSIDVRGGSARVVSCPSGMNYVETNLCIDGSPRTARTYWVEAASQCRKLGYHMCTYGELDQAICHGNSPSVLYNPNGHWIGNVVGEDTVLCGDQDITTPGCKNYFEGSCNKIHSAQRQYWCCLSFGSTQ